MAIPSPDYTGQPPVCARCGGDMGLAGLDRDFKLVREIWLCDHCGYYHTRLAQTVVPRKPKAAWV